MNATDLSLPVVLPEAIIALGALALVLVGALRGDRAHWLVVEIAAALLAAALVAVIVDQRPAASTFFGAFIDDPFSRFMKALALIGSLTTLLLSIDFMRREKIGGFEFPVLILLATLGMMMLISAGDFIALYLGLELMSLS
ncbi:MAG: NADH-quinone oxidoreductase subunit N, partial [Bradyrhizobium sp.]